MTKSLILIAALGASIGAFAGVPAPAPAPEASAAVNTVCPVTCKPVNPKCIFTYEDRTYAFCSGKCRKEFQAKVESSIYHQIGGKAAVDAAVEAFYVKVLADKRVNHYFEDVSMDKQKRKQKAFLSAAFGSPAKWEGKDMRKAHADLPGLNDSHFDAIAGHLQTTLTELKVKKELIDQIMAIAESTRNDVLNRPKAAE